MIWRKKAPVMPKTMNGENSALWGLVMHLNGRIDVLFGIQIAVLLAVIGILVKDWVGD